MSLITAANLSKSYHPVDIFSGISLSIPGGARIAIVGPNGIGKTTLLKTLIGQMQPLAGTVRAGSNVAFGYLSQTHSELEADKTAFDSVCEAGKGLAA